MRPPPPAGGGREPPPPPSHATPRPPRFLLYAVYTERNTIVPHSMFINSIHSWVCASHHMLHNDCKEIGGWLGGMAFLIVTTPFRPGGGG